MTTRISPEAMLSGFFEQNPLSAAVVQGMCLDESVVASFVTFDGDRFVLDIGNGEILDDWHGPIAVRLARAVYKTPLS